VKSSNVTWLAGPRFVYRFQGGHWKFGTYGYSIAFVSKDASFATHLEFLCGSNQRNVSFARTTYNWR
jgi:hypothetical protein